MAPSWSSRLLAGSSNHTGSGSSSPNPAASRSTPARDRPSPSQSVPRRPLDSDLTAIPTLSRPKTSAPHPGHVHNRSVSHPLPKFFSRKQSANNLRRGFNDGDLPVDDSLVPVLEDASSEVSSAGASRTGSHGKRGGQAEEQDGKAQRRCMCCDSRVRVPRKLDKFRCMCCLTINDLRPIARQAGDDVEGRKGKGKEGASHAPVPQTVELPLSIERTRAIVERCLMFYLEARCRRPEESFGNGATKQDDSPDKASAGRVDATAGLGIRREDSSTSKLFSDGPLSSSPPDTPPLDIMPVGAVISFGDGDRPALVREDTPQSEAKATAPRNASAPAPPKQASITRKPVPSPSGRRPGPPPMNLSHRTSSQNLRPNHTSSFNGERSPHVQQSPRLTKQELDERKRYDRVKTIFRPLEDYMLACYGNLDLLNSSFSTVRRAAGGRTRSESNIVAPASEPTASYLPSPMHGLDQLDAKTLLLGDIGENGSWWTGRANGDRSTRRKKVGSTSSKPVTGKSPNIDWTRVAAWYEIVHSAGMDWQRKAERLRDAGAVPMASLEGAANRREIEADLEEAREHAIRALLKVTETLLKRPGGALKEPEDLRFLLIMLANPSLYPSKTRARPRNLQNLHVHRSGSGPANGLAPPDSPRQASSTQQKPPGKDGSQHSGILKRIFGLLGNTPDACHRYAIGWFSRFDEERFTATVDLCASFVTHRISRRSRRPRSRGQQPADGGLIPDLSGGALNTSAQLHSAMGLSGSVKKRGEDAEHETDWADDWQIKGAARVMGLLFAANNIWQGKRRDEEEEDGAARVDPGTSGRVIRPQDKARRSGQLLHTSGFYNTLLDYQDLIADFKVWESRRDKFTFCQYPLFLSMGAKIKILEYDARRQMEIKAREAYFDQVIRQRAIDGHFHLRVRRECMVEDSLRQISAAVGSGQEEVKKGLRVHFAGEEGVDAGGPRKEWFLMLVREVFDADHGLFVYDEESRACYFNPHTFETSDQYYLVGALLGLAIYNSTILDIALPPFAFRKLLAAGGPAGSGGGGGGGGGNGNSNGNGNNNNGNNMPASVTGTKGQMTYTLADLAEYKPGLAAGLQQLLTFEGDVEATYCWSFVAPVERYGAAGEVALVPNGERIPVTKANRAEFVEAYVRHLLDGAVARQFEPFKRGFFTVCAGNALSLFRAEEIELLVRGSDEALDVDSLRGVAVHENWRAEAAPHAPVAEPADGVDVVRWFWRAFAGAPAARQRRLLSFVTGSDRIPAVGATSLVLRVVAGGDGWSGRDAEGRAESDRFPVARTCFNLLVLWRYASREQLEQRLWRAVEDSEGFGLK